MLNMGSFSTNKPFSLLKILIKMTKKEEENKDKIGTSEPTQSTEPKADAANGTDNTPPAEPTATNKDVFLNNIKNKYPEYNEDDVYKHANNSFKQLKDDKGSMEKAVEGLLEAMDKEPLMSRLVQALIKYPHKPSYALKVFSKEDLEEALASYDEPLDEEEANASLSEYKTRKKADQDYSEMFENNTRATQQYIQEVADEKGVEVETIVQVLQEYALPILDGKFSKELITALVDGKDFDKKVEQVAQESYNQGELEGKNATIEKKKLEKATDGTVPPPSAGAIPIKQKKQVPSMFNFEERKEF